MSFLKLSGITKSFKQQKILHELDLSIEQGEFIVILGPSGCGKSTLLRMISGLEQPDSGRVIVDGRDVTEAHPADRQMSMVFQNYALYPHMTCAENMALPLKIAKELSLEEIQGKVGEVSELLKISDLLHKKPGQLSGGQKQRVAIGRAIIKRPKIFLFDEPLSNLDAGLRAHMRAEFKKLHRKLGTTSIYVTHDQIEAMTLADRILVLKDGYIQQFGSPSEVYGSPSNQFVGKFVGSPEMNFLSAESGGDSIRIKGSRGATNYKAGASAKAIIAGLRPDFHEDKNLPSTEFKGKVVFKEVLGSEILLTLDIEGQMFIRKEKATCRVEEGEDMLLSVPHKEFHLFSENGSRIQDLV